MVCRWRIFGDILRPVFPASRVQHVLDLHLKFAVKPHHVWKYGKTSNLRRLRLGEKKKEDRNKKIEETTGLPYSSGHEVFRHR